MRKTRALAAAGAAVAVLGVAAPVAVADGGRVPNPSNIVALPSVIARGGQLTITVDGCPNGGHATSNAFPRTNLTPVSGGNDAGRGGNDAGRGGMDAGGGGNDAGRGGMDAGGGGNDAGRGGVDAGRGGHDTARGVATIHQDARPGSYDITVHCSGRSLTRPAAFTVIGGVRGGIGGSSTTGATPTDMAIGGSLVAAAVVGSGFFWMRRRAEKRI
ncbi:hypothetical protein [Streptomyces werraensis]|uniref:hypothetical protein n=1 Tax=Streptomyces werraensis TaxID=68284 RepID=UPI0016797560|nr:hypothetical protein GCM10018789_19690 [Streptomyces werraensis]